MIIRTKVQAKIYPDELNRKVHRAEHAVAVQAERDSRPYIPAATGRLRSSGRVYGNAIVWDPPYARMLWYGNVKVDPKYRKAGFVYPNLGIVRSRAGVKKVLASPKRKFKFREGEAYWFYDAMRAKVGHWITLAQGVIARE